MSQQTSSQLLRELRGDLCHKYQQHGAAVERIWRSLDQRQRTACLKAGVMEGALLKHRMDRSLGIVCKLVPEINERDITKPGSDYLLEILRHRATTTLVEQYCTGGSVTEGQGDLEFIEQMMRTRNLQLAGSFKNCYSLFLDEEKYGEAYEIRSHLEEFLRVMAQGIAQRLVIPKSTGELVVLRQMSLMQHLNLLIDDILEADQQSRRAETKKKKQPQKKKSAAASAQAQLTFRAAPVKPVLVDLVASVREQQADLADCVRLLLTEPEMLAHMVNGWFFSQPELVPDEKGRVLPAHTSRYISGSVLDTLREAVQAAATWWYLERLLERLTSDDGARSDKAYRALVLQELANTCQAEFERTQALLKRHVQLGSGAKRFRRVSAVSAAAAARGPRVTARGNPAELTRSDPQLHYLLRLCQGDSAAATPALALDWMKKLSELHSAHPEERDRLTEREVDALGDMAVIVSFVQALAQSPAVALPPFSRPKKSRGRDPGASHGQAWVRRTQSLAAELAVMRPQIDLRDYVVPIDNLLEPGVAEQALRALDQQVEVATGSRLGFLYDDLVDDCVAALEEQHRQQKAAAAALAAAEPVPMVLDTAKEEEEEEEETCESRVARRKQKEKTRPAAVSAYDVVSEEPEKPTMSTTSSSAATVAVPVSAASAAVFSALFARRSVSWTNFESAMADAGFAVEPKFGSVYTFSPSIDASGLRSITLHRPHRSKIEGCASLLVARRLQRRLGWTAASFQTRAR